MSDDQLVILCDKMDTTQIKIRKSLIEKSNLLLQCLETTTSEDCPKIPIGTADEWALKKLVEWLEAHENGDMVLTEQEVKDLNVMDPFDQEWFGKMLHAEILSIIRLANYLQIPRLLDNSCKFVARMISGMKIEEIRQNFGIKNDFTPEEEEQIHCENAWAYEN